MTLPKNMRAVVTGAGSGIGRAFCVEVARRSGSVLASDVDEAAAHETARLVEKAGGVGLAARCDVAKLDDVERLAREAEERLGGVDLLVNNAGVAVSGRVGDVPLEDWRWLMDINLWGVVYGCHVFVPRFRAQGYGTILNVASAAGLLSAPDMGPYNVSKAGVISLSETLAGELHGTGVSVSVLCPTFIKTNIHKAARSSDPKMLEVAEALMERGTHTADQVARIALDAASRGDLYVLPQQDGRWAWRLKRMDPARFYRVIGPEITKHLGGDEPPGIQSFLRSFFKSRKRADASG
jgi:NAD(P)-dependent dehydrogenase (short-subunit alcohol dehydrogenase family)